MNKSALSPIEIGVKNHLENYFSHGDDPKFIIGVSGGPDSMALLYIFKKLGVDAIVVHINYQKRGGDSDKDEELVRAMATQWNYDCHCIRLDPEEAEGENFQQWAREERYRVFRELKSEYKADGIAVAHHQDDQVETILQKLFRGAGLGSWAGMSVWDAPLFRPLLDTTREEIITYIKQEAVPSRTDRSNLEPGFARNLLRNEWLDKLEEYFPGWKQNILRMPGQARIFGETLEFIEQQITDNRDRIEARSFLDISPALQKALILYLLKKRDPAVEISTQALDQIEGISSLQTGKAIQMNEAYSLLLDREWLKIVYERSEALELIKLKPDELRAHSFSFNELVFSIQPFDNPDYEKALYMDIEKLRWPLSLRRWKAGDLFQPLGMTGHQKVSDHLTNRKISASERNKALVLESFEETICAVIFPPIEKLNPPGAISGLVRCDDETSECLAIEWKE